MFKMFKIKNKVIKTIKYDIFDRNFTSLKLVRPLKDIKSNLFFKIKKVFRSRKLSYKNGQLFKKILNSLKFKKIRNSYSKGLNFNAKNNKNVFIRTKRKSSFGKTLLEKQKFKFLFSNLQEKNIKKAYQKKKENFCSFLEKRNDFTLNNIFLMDSSSSLKRKLSLGTNLYRNDTELKYSEKYNNYQNNIISYNVDNLSNLYFFKLHYIKNLTKNKIIINYNFYNRSLPNNIFLDHRLNKFKLLDLQFNNKYFLNKKKVLQHYRVKRS